MGRKHLQRAPSSLSSSSSCHCISELDEETMHVGSASSPDRMNKKWLSKQLSMCETPRDLAWEKRRQQMLRPRNYSSTEKDDLTNEDWNELKACIELGFAFNEEDGHKLCNTLPALDLYFAVNRQLMMSPITSPHSSKSTSALERTSSSTVSSKSDCDNTWRVCNPGESPKQVQAKLKHWAQAVACSVLQSMGEK